MSNIVKLTLLAIIIVFVILIASNPNNPKDYMGWIFENQETHAVLPDLSNEEIEKVNNDVLELPVENLKMKQVDEIPVEIVAPSDVVQ
ncbi:MAG TPA: hypothetical protein VI861_00990 [Rickettsiales bacterium]|nr:hypothetical protein [Rickettsiales bacterium]